MVFVHRPHRLSFPVYSASSCSDTGTGVTPCSVQKWTKSILGVGCIHLLWELSPQQRYRAAWGGEVVILVQGVCCVVCDCF